MFVGFLCTVRSYIINNTERVHRRQIYPKIATKGTS